MYRTCVTILILVCTSITAWAAGDAANGKKLIKSWYCLDCHGYSGNSPSPVPDQYVPKLAGQPVNFLIKRMKEYRSGALDHLEDWSNMKARLKALNDQQIEDMATHWSMQKRW